MSYNKIAASLAIGATVAGSAWLIYSNVCSYKSGMVAYTEALSRVNPAEAQRWSRAFAYERAVAGLRNQYLRSNSRTVSINTGHTWHSITVTDPPPPFSQFWSGLSPKKLTNLEQLARAAGYTLSEARLQILSGDVALAGPSPFPIQPSRAWTGFITTSQVLGVSLVGGGVAAWLHFADKQ